MAFLPDPDGCGSDDECDLKRQRHNLLMIRLILHNAGIEKLNKKLYHRIVEQIADYE